MSDKKVIEALEQRCPDCFNGARRNISMEGYEYLAGPNGDRCETCKGRGWVIPEGEGK